MADQDDPELQRSLATTLPPPPPFYKDFTPEKLARFEEIIEAETYVDEYGCRVPSRVRLPPELVNLQPPPEPNDGVWRCFGDRFTLRDELPTLEEQGIERLVPQEEPIEGDGEKDRRHIDRGLELKRLAKSLLLNFLELVGVLSINPDHAPEKIQDISTMLINFHHMINEYRPHQARESLIELMQSKLDRIRQETAAIRASVDQARRALVGLGSIEIPTDEQLFLDQVGSPNDLKAREAEEQREQGLWAALDKRGL